MNKDLYTQLNIILENSFSSKIGNVAKTLGKPVVASFNFLKNSADKVNYSPQKETPGLSRMDKINTRSAEEVHTAATAGKENFHKHAINRTTNAFNTGGNDLTPEEKFKMDRRMSANKIG
mgnify:FL=1